jgi:D-hydroxyproline dehydrogenase subunit beta
VLAGEALAGVRTSRGVFSAPLVVLAAGPWSGEVAGRLGAPVPVLPRRGMLLVTATMRQRVWHKVYDADYVGAVSSGDAALQTSTVVESTRGGTILIGSSRQRCGFDTALDVAVLGELARKAIRLFPFLDTVPVIRTYGGFRPYLPDHLPLIGADHRLPGLWHASGHEGAGIGLASATAELLVAQATGATPTIDPAPFAVDRPSLAGHLAEAA